MEPNVGGLLPLEAWHVNTLRVTAFPIPAAPAKDYRWWAALVGEPPESTINRPRESARRDEGPFNGGRLINDIRPIRIDWLLTPSPEQVVEAVDLPSVGFLPKILDSFVNLMVHWFELETCPSLVRLAFGAIVFHPIETKAAGYRQLAAYLPYVQLDSETASDFFYQINRPRPSQSGIPGLTVNRLSKWSIAAGKRVELLLQPVPQARSIGDDSYACKLELDTNTHQTRRDELPHDSLRPLFLELVDLAKEIVSKGDIP